MSAGRRQLVAFLTPVLVLILGAACAKPPGAGQSGPPGGEGRAVRIEGAGTGAGGTLFGPASTRGVIVIAGEDREAWKALALELGQSGYSVLLFRQPRGDRAAAVRAAAATLRGRGVEKVVLIAGDRDVGDALAAASEGADGVAALNPAAQHDPVPAAGMPPVPLLALASLTDAGSSAQARRLYDAAQEPRTLALYPARSAAVGLITGDEPSELKSVLLEFLRSAFEPLSALRKRG